MTEDNDGMTQIMEAHHDADETLHFAILDFLETHQGRLMGRNMLGMQFALLRHAARMQLILKGPNTSKQKFLDAAEAEFDDVAEYRRENPAKDPQKNPPKSSGFHVVK